MPTIERAGARIHFDDRGAGEPLVLLHSFLCSGEMWAPQVPVFEQRFRVVNVDFRGHGASGPARSPLTLYELVDDVLAVLDALGIERAAWAGLSIGGMVSLRAALRAPQRVSRLLLLDTDAGSERHATRIRHSVLALGVRAAGFRPLLPAILPLFFCEATRLRRPRLVEEWRERLAALHVPSMLSVLRALDGRDSIVARLGEIPAPALVLVGAEDRSLPPAVSRRIVEGLADARFVIVEEAGHLSNLEQPETVTAAMLEFLAS